MSSVSFVSNQKKFKLKESARHRTWVERIIIANHKFPSQIQFIFSSDEFLADLNQQYLKHSTLTDIITFNYNSGHYISGDIFISIDRVKENAEKFKTDFNTELQRVMIHGILHLLGFNDKTEAEKKKIRKKEDECLEILKHIS